jgi:hypothetical protein
LPTTSATRSAASAGTLNKNTISMVKKRSMLMFPRAVAAKLLHVSRLKIKKLPAGGRGVK